MVFCFIALFSFTYSFYVIKQPEIFGTEIKFKEKKKITRKNRKYSKSGLRDEQAVAYLDTLISVMETDKPYLNRDLSIQDLSEITDIPVTILRRC